MIATSACDLSRMEVRYPTLSFSPPPPLPPPLPNLTRNTALWRYTLKEATGFAFQPRRGLAPARTLLHKHNGS